jgi:hypothetical protein
MLRPIYRRIADMGNPDVFAATTLLVVLGTSVLTQVAGLSLALGAFLVSFPPMTLHPLNRICHSHTCAHTCWCLLIERSTCSRGYCMSVLLAQALGSR